MPKYAVTLIETLVYTIDVDADNVESAETVARDTWCASSNPEKEFSAFSEGHTIGRVESVE